MLQYSAEEKIRMDLYGLQGEHSISRLSAVRGPQRACEHSSHFDQLPGGV
jgi:hypothetical protein